MNKSIRDVLRRITAKKTKKKNTDTATWGDMQDLHNHIQASHDELKKFIAVAISKK